MAKPPTNSDFNSARRLSPRRKSSQARTIAQLAAEQLAHYAIDAESPMGKSLLAITTQIYKANVEMDHLWQATIGALVGLEKKDRIAYFNAKKFLCFQLAKLLDNLQTPFRRTYQSLVNEPSVRMAKGPYPIFDNVTAIFSATPVITRTATYLYACTEWIDDAFQGKEMLLEVYSRLLNPTSVSLANHIVDLECGHLAPEYMAWNFNSGMAAIDTLLAHTLGYQDIVVCSRNVYGGTYQLLHDWYGKASNLDIGVVWFDGYGAADFDAALTRAREQHRARLQQGRNILVFLESPCNPHGYMLDVPAICAHAHTQGLTVMLDATIATPFLYRPFMRDALRERPDYVIHSYTKDITGTGVATAGVVIGRNELMFIPKHESVTVAQTDGTQRVHHWQDSLFWNVYYVKGAFLDADKAFEVITGSRTLELRMMRKAINTTVLAAFFASHPAFQVHCNALTDNDNAPLRARLLYLALPAPLFTVDMEHSGIDKITFTRLFDCLEPSFGHMVSLGQSNTLVLCPALTSHSEMSPERLKEAGITPTTIRISVGDEDVRHLIAHFISVTELVLDPMIPGFSRQFMSAPAVDQLYRQTYLSAHEQWFDAQPSLQKVLS